MNRGDYRQAILDELSKSSTDVFHTTAILNRFVQRSVDFCAKYKPWQQTQRALKQTVTPVGDETDEYWDYPESFYSDSIYRLKVGSDTYDPIIFSEYENHKEENPTSEKIWSDHRRQYFIYPVLTAESIISVWGHERPTAFTGDSDVTPFVDDAQIEEAILGYALGLALKKMRGSYLAQGEKRQAEAIALLNAAWAEQQKKQAQKKTKDAEIWQHTDFLSQRGGDRVTKRGSFNLDF